ncbi:PAS domain S-box protein [Frateuria aurantia]|uniref:PAS domain S-box n=1 Tax=Frateuria aurantia (strain ATCC 33424 / DSM 6220 / KCTC 2777 / LMG 1558 / NBRC 3245 / NCIMB 13370) TaxID=767434 RepID=H8KZ75_FRAAD|nr:PAS domain S-box protein [Frateuria aurantia]AFC85179.1 PAS domain S-box [Frateuria aurantia DSM 6220]
MADQQWLRRGLAWACGKLGMEGRDHDAARLGAETAEARVVVDSRGRIRFCNGAAAGLWDCQARDLEGQRLADCLHEPLSTDQVPAGRLCLQLRRGDGQVLELVWNCSEEGPKGWRVLSRATGPASSGSRHTIEQALEQALDAVIMIDGQNAVTFFNAAAEKLWGYARDEVLGRNVRMLVPMEIQSRHDGYVNRHRDGGGNKIVGTSREVELERRDGSRCWVSLALSPLLVDGVKGYTAFVRDVSVEVRQREQVRLLSMVADETDSPVIITGAEGLIEYVNTGFERLSGYSATDVIGRKPGAVLQGAHTDPVTVARIRSSLAAGKALYEEILNYRRDGSPYWASMVINPVHDSAGLVIKYVGVMSNITDSKSRAMDDHVRLQAIGRTSLVAEWSLSGECLQANPLLRQQLGQVQGDLRLESLPTLLSETDWQALLNGGDVVARIGMPLEDGGTLRLAAAFSLLYDVELRPRMIVMYAQDVTEQDTAVDDLVSLTRRVEHIADDIRQVAMQTHMLSLNAAIEAAHAGDGGRGFAVLATEIRRLAQQSKTSASEIGQLLSEANRRLAAADDSRARREAA